MTLEEYEPTSYYHNSGTLDPEEVSSEIVGIEDPEEDILGSFGIDEDGISHYSNQPEYVQDSLDLVYECDPQKSKYVAILDNGQIISSYTFDELEKTADGAGLPFWSYCNQRNIVEVVPFIDDSLDAQTAAIEQLKLVKEEFWLRAAYLIADAVNVASCIGVIDANIISNDVEKKLLEFLRLGIICEDKRPSPQEQASIQCFKKKISGINKADARKQCEEAVKKFIKDNKLIKNRH